MKVSASRLPRTGTGRVEKGWFLRTKARRKWPKRRIWERRARNGLFLGQDRLLPKLHPDPVQPPAPGVGLERITGARLIEGYGLSEASPVTHSNPVQGEIRKGSIGLPLPSVEAKVVDEEGREVPIGEVGELIVKGPNVMRGYWNRPEETQKALRNGWLYTGDMARMDPDGYFYIVDRKKDMIIAGGYNIYPREVEEVLYGHPAVQEAAVIGVPDPYRGETVAAFIVLKDEYRGKVTQDEIEKFCRENLAAYKVPRIIEFRESLPKSSVGKILKRELRDEVAKKRP